MHVVMMCWFSFLLFGLCSSLLFFFIFVFQYYNQKRAFPISENLKHLELIVEADHRWALHHLTYFLKAFPCLQRLAVKVCICSTQVDYMVKYGILDVCALRLILFISYYLHCQL